MSDRLLRARRGKDDGVALVVAIATMGLVVVMIMTIVVFVMRENRQSGNNRQRAVAVTTAEGAVDKALADIQNNSVPSLPCGTSNVTSSENPPEVLTISTTVEYYSAAGILVAGGSQPCPLTVEAATAVVTATSATGPLGGGSGGVKADRTIETSIKLKPTYANSLDKAVFGQEGVSVEGNVDIVGTAGKTNADVYSNGDIVCDKGNMKFFGSVYTPLGEVESSSTCVFHVDVHARDMFTGSGNGTTVLGNVKVYSGPVKMTSNVNLSGTATSVAPELGNYCSSAASGKCTFWTANNGIDGFYESFPGLVWNATTKTAWRTAPASDGGGYVGYVELNDCVKDKDGLNEAARWFLNRADKIDEPTILRTTCALDLSKSSYDVKLGSNLAVFADGGIHLKSTEINSTLAAAPARDLYLIQPANIATCSNPGISLESTVTLGAYVRGLLYSPCDVYKANKGVLEGQVYSGGKLTMGNNSHITFSAMPIWGLPASTTKVEFYELDILYKREISN